MINAPQAELDNTVSEDDAGGNRRRSERLNLSLPIEAKCHESASVSWEEITRLIDVTPFGAGFTLSRSIEVGRILLLKIPMPRQLRCYDHAEIQYQVWALVRHVRRVIDADPTENVYSIGVAFVGKFPPADFYENPAQVYEVIDPNSQGFWRVRKQSALSGFAAQNEQNIDSRRHTRLEIPLNVIIEVFNEAGETVASEMTATENVSRTGASVLTTLEVERGRFVRLSCDEYDVTIVAVVRARKTGKNGIARLHLEFIDREFPLELFG